MSSPLGPSCRECPIAPASLLFTSYVGRLFHAVIYVDLSLNLTMKLNIGKSVIVFVVYLDRQLVNRMQLLTCFS